MTKIFKGQADSAREALRSGSLDESIEACVTLGRARAVDDLMGALASPSWRLRDAAVRALAEAGAGDPARLVAVALHDESIWPRISALSALPRLDPTLEATGPLLLEALRTGPSQARCRALSALVRLGLASQHVHELALALADPDDEVRVAAARALAELGEAAEGTVPALMELVGHESGMVREAAVHTLGVLAPSLAVEALIRALVDPLPAVRSAALVALGEVEQREVAGQVVPDILRLMEKDGDLQREQAASSLARLDQVWSAVPSILDMLRHHQWSLRRVAWDILGAQPLPAPEAPSEAVETIQGRIRALEPHLARVALYDPDRVVRERATWFLGRVFTGTGQVIEDITTAADHPRVVLRRRAILLLSHLRAGGPHVVQSLERALVDPGAKVRRVATMTLGRLGALGAFPSLFRRCFDYDPLVMHYAQDAIKAMVELDGDVRRIWKRYQAHAQEPRVDVLQDLLHSALEALSPEARASFQALCASRLGWHQRLMEARDLRIATLSGLDLPDATRDMVAAPMADLEAYALTVMLGHMAILSHYLKDDGGRGRGEWERRVQAKEYAWLVARLWRMRP